MRVPTILTRGLLPGTPNLRNVRSKFTDRSRTFTSRPLSNARSTEEDLNRVSVKILPSSQLSIGTVEVAMQLLREKTTMISLTEKETKKKEKRGKEVRVTVRDEK